MKNEVQTLWSKPPPQIDWLIDRFLSPQHVLFLPRKSSMIGGTMLVRSPKTKNTIMPQGNVELTALTLVRLVDHLAARTRSLDVQDDTLDVLWAPQIIAENHSLSWLNSIILIEFNQGASVTKICKYQMVRTTTVDSPSGQNDVRGDTLNPESYDTSDWHFLCHRCILWHK